MATKSSKGIVIFGPFIGEFGWELMHWSMWVENVSKTYFTNYEKIVISRKGFNCLYPSADQFITIPDSITRKIKSPRNYICDGLFFGYPSSNTIWNYRFKTAMLDLFKLKIPRKYSIDKSEMDLGLLKDLNLFRNEIEKNQESGNKLIRFSPYELNHFNKITFGFDSRGDLNNLSQPKRIIPIKLNDQTFKKLIVPATQNSNEITLSNSKNERKFVCLFPRKRLDRRADKNLSESEYLVIIRSLKSKFKVAILGTPNGSFFSNGVPDGCLDFINLPDENRLEQQIRVLSQSLFAVGGTSGALLLACRVGIPIKMIGPNSELKRLKSYDVFRAGVSEFQI
jgi:ADP-heptose:LPS heptosyltransferase